MKWLSLLLWSGLSAHATVLFQGPQSSPLDYAAELAAHPHWVSPVQDYVNRHPLSANREQLSSLFAQAQHDFLAKSELESRERYKAVINLLGMDDWTKSEREIFLQCYLRLAQLESDNSARDRWLKQSLALGSELDIDASLYPPPLLQRRKELATYPQMLALSRLHLSAEWARILINGQPCGKKDCGLWPKDVRLRVTVLSNQWLPQSRTIEARRFAEYQPEAIPWVEGACNTNHWHPETERFADRMAFWSIECAAPVADSFNLSAVAPPTTAPDAVPKLQEAPAPEYRPFYKSTWFWVGAGVVTAAVIVGIASQHPREVKQTTTTYGLAP